MGLKAVVGAGLIAGVLLFPLVGQRVAAEEASDAHAEWVSAVWGRNCQKCHAVPDPAYETDRAFLGQIMETT